MPLNLHRPIVLLSVPLLSVAGFVGCSGQKVQAGGAGTAPAVTVGVVPIGRKPIMRQITISSELVPFQEIEVYAKESGYLKQLLVDYGTRVQKGQLMAVLEIPELQMQLQQDAAAIKNRQDMIAQAQHQIARLEAQVKVYHLQYTRLKSVSDSKPGLVAQQEVDDSQGKDLAAQAQLEAAKSTWESAQSELLAAQAKQQHDQVLFDYSKVTAPFSGVVTQRYANEGTLVQAGTSSATNVLPIAKLSQDDKFRLVIPVPETYVKFIHVGDGVDVEVPSLDRHFPGKVARFSVDVSSDTRTMHTEVDVENPKHVLIQGMYAQAKLTLERRADPLAVPLQAVNHEADRTTVYVVTADNKIEDRPVQLGLQSASDSEVLSGLHAGDQVVVSDRSALKPGEIVSPHKVEAVEYQPQE